MENDLFSSNSSYFELSICRSSNCCSPDNAEGTKKAPCPCPTTADEFYSCYQCELHTTCKAAAESLLDNIKFLGYTWRPTTLISRCTGDKNNRNVNVAVWKNEKGCAELEDIDVRYVGKPFAFVDTVFRTPPNQNDNFPKYNLRHQSPLPLPVPPLIHPPQAPSPPPLCNFSSVRPTPPGYSYGVVHKRFCQSKIMELWQILSSNLKKAELTLYGDLWLPPNELDFTIDIKSGDCIKTILALRTPIWPPNVTKILLICVKKIPCGRDDSCLRRLRDQTRWMKNDLHNHVAAYKSFRQLKYNNMNFWYLPRHSCEFNLERFLSSSLYAPVVAEFLVRDLFHGLDYLHTQAQHLFHGNLKPSNLLIDLKSDGRLSLILVDFGFGRLRCPRISSLNEIRCYVNEYNKKLDDLCWKPPEFLDSTDHCSPTPKYDTPSDMYSAALLTYFMLARRHPFVNRYDMTLIHLRRAMHEECHYLNLVDVEIQAVLRSLFYHDAKLRPKACDILKQPICWTPEQRNKFLLRVADVLTRNNCLESQIGATLCAKRWRYDDWLRDLPGVVCRKVETVLGQQYQASIAALILALKFYREAKRNNEIPSTCTCHWLPDEDYQFCLRYPTLFWDVYRIVNSYPNLNSLKFSINYACR